MKRRLTDQQVQDLVSGMKRFDAEYPPELLASRRKLFLGQIAAIGILGTSASNSAAGSTSSSGIASGSGLFYIGPFIGKLAGAAIATILVVATTIVTYQNWYRISHLIGPGSSPTIEVTSSPPPTSPTPAPSSTNTPQPSATSTQIETLTPSATPSPASEPASVSTPTPKKNGGILPSSTIQPTETHKATEEPKHTETPSPTGESDITETPTRGPTTSTETPIVKNPPVPD